MTKQAIQDKLNVAFRPESALAEPIAKDLVEIPTSSDIITTDDEIQAFMNVRAIAAKVVDSDRITLRDAKSYCSVFVDDNNRKPVCRFYFNAKNSKSLGVFDEQKVETKITLERIADIYKFSKQIEDAIQAFS